MNEEELKQENEQLRSVIKQLRKQLDFYRRQSKCQYQLDKDFVPYNEDDRRD